MTGPVQWPGTGPLTGSRPEQLQGEDRGPVNAGRARAGVLYTDYPPL